MTSEVDFGVFLATRNKQRVSRERFKVWPLEAERREYDQTTEANLLFIRTQERNERRTT